MTLCVALTTADGLVMGTDSMTLAREGPYAKTYSTADKLFELPGLPIAVMTYGLAGLGRRSIGSLIDEWSTRRPPYEKGDDDYSVEQIARDLGEWIFSQHRAHLERIEADIEQQQRDQLSDPEAAKRSPIRPFDPAEWRLGLVVGGYQPGSFFPWLWSWEEPARSQELAGIQHVRPYEATDGEGVEGTAFCVEYWGVTRALSRLTEGFDTILLGQLVRTKIVDPKRADDLLEVLESHRWRTLVEGIPLKDAVDMVRYLLEVGSGFERFVQGTAQVGGEFDIAVVTRSGIHWPHRKEMTRALYQHPRAPAPVRSRRDEKKGSKAP